MKIYDLKDRLEYLKEVVILTKNEWGKLYSNEEEFNLEVEKKMQKEMVNFDNPNYCKLILLDDNILVGFISLFPTDGEERQDLTPWYATMFVKKEYRGKGLSKMLNDAILEDAKKRKFKKIYLKTELINYYEKFGFVYMEKLNNGENLYYRKVK